MLEPEKGRREAAGKQDFPAAPSLQSLPIRIKSLLEEKHNQTPTTEGTFHYNKANIIYSDMATYILFIISFIWLYLL